MIEKLKAAFKALPDALEATVRDIVLAAVAAGFGAAVVIIKAGGVTLPVLKAAAVAALYAAGRAALSALASAIKARRDAE